jgi:hypothetical protein
VISVIGHSVCSPCSLVASSQAVLSFERCLITRTLFEKLALLAMFGAFRQLISAYSPSLGAVSALRNETRKRDPDV